MRQTKIVCTVGPATDDRRAVRRLVDSGVDVFRINFSHGTRNEHLHEIRTIRSEAERAGRIVAILQDLPGPKIRVGRFRGGSVELNRGSTFVLTSRSILGDEGRASLNYSEMVTSLKRGDTLHLADGLIRLRVEDVSSQEARCTVVAGGTLSSGKGVNAPGIKMKLAYPTPEDIGHLRFGLDHGVDFIALSFVRDPSDVRAVRKLIRGAGVSIVVKVEKREAVEHIGSLVSEADGVMVARGDLGLEIPIERVPIVQKEIIERCNEAGKPVIVATQMLVSMVNNPVPTRAEATDVSTAVLDGADAVMLSEETAVGRYPVEAVLTLERIVKATEKVLGRYTGERPDAGTSPAEEAIARAACRLAKYVGAKAIAAPTQTGSTPRRVSKYRPAQPILALCSVASVARRLKLNWGVVPLVARQFGSTDSLFARAEGAARSMGLVSAGDTMVMTSGTPGLGGSTDLIKLMTIGAAARTRR